MTVKVTAEKTRIREKRMWQLMWQSRCQSRWQLRKPHVWQAEVTVKVTAEKTRIREKRMWQLRWQWRLQSRWQLMWQRKWQLNWQLRWHWCESWVISSGDDGGNKECGSWEDRIHDIWGDSEGHSKVTVNATMRWQDRGGDSVEYSSGGRKRAWNKDNACF